MDIWLDINGEVKVAVFLSKHYFSVAKFFMHMFNMSKINLQSIRIRQYVLRVKWILPYFLAVPSQNI